MIWDDSQYPLKQCQLFVSMFVFVVKDKTRTKNQLIEF